MHSSPVIVSTLFAQDGFFGFLVFGLLPLGFPEDGLLDLGLPVVDLPVFALPVLRLLDVGLSSFVLLVVGLPEVVLPSLGLPVVGLLAFSSGIFFCPPAPFGSAAASFLPVTGRGRSLVATSPVT